MATIQHKITVKASPAKTTQALSTLIGLSNWWTRDVSGNPEPGNEILFRFGNMGGPKMKVLEVAPNEAIRWQCTEGPPDWKGTHLNFLLSEKDGSTVVRFEHKDWPSQTDFLGHCSLKWGTFLLSLKSYLETGEGKPFPDDIQID